MPRRPGEKTARDLDREVREIAASEAVLGRGDVYTSLLPGSDDYEVVARAVPAARAHRVSRWAPPDQAALARVLTYVRDFARRSLRPTFPHLVAGGDGRVGYVYHALGSRDRVDPTVAALSSYDRAAAAEAIARQAALEIGILVPGMEGSVRRRGAGTP